MPLQLKTVLAEHGITQAEWAAAVIQTGGSHAGQPLSHSAAAQLINWDGWPRLTPKRQIQEQTEAYLRSRGVPEHRIAVIWLVDVEDRGRDMQPDRALKKNARHKAGREQFDSENQLPETEMLSQPAKRHFHLFKDPCTDDVQGPDDVFLADEQRYIREAMFQAAKHGGFLAVIGESGAGKTTLRRDLIDRIQRESQPVTFIQPRIIDKGKLSAGLICDAIIGDVSQERPARSLEAKARQIERLLVGSSRSGNNHALVIEEAHDLSVQTLKYLKRFWEMEDGFRKLLAIVLIGQPELKHKLDERQNWAAREVIRRCEVAELMPLNGDLEAYLQLKFKRIGKELAEVFTADAYAAIRERLTLRRRGTDQTVSMLYPLVVNNLVVKAMNLAAEIGESRVSADVIKGV